MPGNQTGSELNNSEAFLSYTCLCCILIYSDLVADRREVLLVRDDFCVKATQVCWSVDTVGIHLVVVMTSEQVFPVLNRKQAHTHGFDNWSLFGIIRIDCGSVVLLLDLHCMAQMTQFPFYVLYKCIPPPKRCDNVEFAVPKMFSCAS